MPLDIRRLPIDYAAAMTDRHAALFIGAGMSRDSGYVNWKGLLRECAIELGLDVDQEHDLPAVAQYYVNRRDRVFLNKALISEFDKPGAHTENHKIIARLPIPTIWTTNFDRLLEEAVTASGKTIAIKSSDDDIGVGKKKDVVLYKMHGDVLNPGKIIICRNDYERYPRSHPLFQNTLEGDLLSKTFLFLGFSFNDPNLNYVLGHLRTLLDNNSSRIHYAVMRRVRFDAHNSNKLEAQREFDRKRSKQDLQIENLHHYRIETLLIDEHREVTDVLNAIEQEYFKKTICVLGAFEEFGNFTQDRLANLCREMVSRLIDREFKLVTDLGRNVGDSIVEGALLKLHGRPESTIEQHLILRPFAQHFPGQRTPTALNRGPRDALIAKCGVAIFIGGTGADCNQLLDDFESAKKLKKILIPLPGTGVASEQIWQAIRQDFHAFYPNSVSPELFKQLNDSDLDNGKLLDAVFSLIHSFSSEKPRPSSPETSSGVSFAVKLFWELKAKHLLLSDEDLLDIVEKVTGIRPPPSDLEEGQ